MRAASILLIASVVICISCNNGSTSKGFDNKELRHIADLQDRRSTDSLLIYLQSDDINLKRAAALALGSVQDSTASVRLGDILLNETDTVLRRNAAFALGQIGNFAAVNALIPSITTPNLAVRAEALEALGKSVGKNDLKSLVMVPEQDTLTLSGISWGLYRAAVRSVVDSTAVSRAALILGDPSGKSARLAAAQFFSRSPLKGEKIPAAVLTAASGDYDPEVRMSAVNALTKVEPEETLATLDKAINDADYRVRVSVARALRTHPWFVSKPYFEKLLADPNVHVTVAAAEAIVPLAPATAAADVLKWADNASNWRTQANLYACALKLNQSTSTSEKIRSLITSSTNDYQKAALIDALGNHSSNVDFIFEQFKGTEVKVIKSTSANSLEKINLSKNLSKDEQLKYVDIYREIIASGDLGSIIYACDALGDSTLGFKSIITDYSFLETAKAKLSLPRDYETYVPLERTLNYFKGLPPPKKLENKFNHPIDWTIAKEIKSEQKVLIQTTKGDITLVLFLDEAPGSVVNFVKLVKDNYYDGKIFHRVVPNFVIQTGCNRGDGFGGEDYSIRSEFSKRKYKAGSVGMASAGKDTEGTQWFITHSPTPHLDGRYTIFAEVVSGMDVVHKIEVGDKIVKASLVGL